jgi:hypothetical protein
MVGSSIKYVPATEDNSCVPACLAMVLGKTLKQVLRDIYEYWEDEGKLNGVTDEIMDQYLAINGFAVQRINFEYEPSKLLIEEWPVDPFAPIHMVDVWSTSPPGTHSVVMDNKGKVYDPSNRKIKKLQEYQRVYAVIGIWKVSTSLLTITNS